MGQRTNTATWLPNQQRWQINVQKNGVRRSFTSSKPGRTGQREANAKADAWLDDGISNTRMLVEAAYPQWIGELKLTTSRSNWEPIQSRWNVWVRPVIGRRRVGDLTEQQLQAIINKGFAGGLSKKYLSNMCTDLTMFCKWLRLSKMSTLRPEELHVPKGARSKEKEILQPEDLRTLFEVDTTILDGKLIEDSYVNAYRFSVVTGLRPGELIGLSWKDVKGGRVKIRRAINTRGEETRGKNDNAVRAFALTDSAAAILQAQKKLTGGQESVFGISCEDTYRKYWRRYCEANGLHYVPPYNLRHTFVSLAKRCQRDKSSPWLATPARWTRSGSTRILFMARMCRLPQTWTTFSAGFLIRKVLRNNTFCNTFLFLAPCLRFPSRRSGFRNLTEVRWMCMPGFRRKSSGPGSTPVGGMKKST